MTRPATTTELRKFGFLVGGIFAAIGVWPVVHAHAPRGWALGVGALLGLPAAVAPASLGLAHRGWIGLGHLLGWINARILLTVLFYSVVTPIGLLRRLLGQDPMRRARDAKTATYRVPKEPRPPEHLFRGF